MAVPVHLGDTSALRKHCERRFARLKEARQPWLDYCRSVATEILPSRLPYLIDPLSGQRAGEQNTHLCDSVGPRSVRTTAAAIQSGTMPKTSKWFRLEVRGEFSDDDDLRDWLDKNGDRMTTVHNQSNADTATSPFCLEYIAFGTGALLFFEDEEDVYRLEAMSVGEYCIAEDGRRRVDTLYRELTMTVGQLADEFGVERLSPSSRTAYDAGEFDRVVPCKHCCEPDRWGHNPPELPWLSVYYEDIGNCDQVLAVRGFHRFPALVARAELLPGTAYGYGLGMDALPHLVRLRKMIYRYGQAVAQKADPAMQYPAGLKEHQVRTLPGGKTPMFGQQKAEQLMRIDLELRELAEEIEKTRQDIRDVLGATLVASLRAINRQITAREADLRTQQDLTEWLPSLYRLTDEVLNPYVEMIWAAMEPRGMLVAAPESLGQEQIDIEFTSPLARKQRQGEVDAIVRTYAIAGEVSKIRADVLDNLDPDDAIRRIGAIEGAPVSVLVPIEQVRQLRKAKQQAQMAEQQAAAVAQGAETLKTASEAVQAGAA